jgi:hypothetical protein
MTLIAKPIVKNQLWVITDGVSKVGNVEADGAGYNVKIGDSQAHFASTKSIEKMVQIEFERPQKPVKHNDKPYAIWPTSKKNTYNDALDVKRKLHIYTETKSSKCYHVAGWFNINMNGEWQTVFCPKYIFVQRYEYQGPFMSRTDAEVDK